MCICVFGQSIFAYRLHAESNIPQRAGKHLMYKPDILKVFRAKYITYTRIIYIRFRLLSQLYQIARRENRRKVFCSKPRTIRTNCVPIRIVWVYVPLCFLKEANAKLKHDLNEAKRHRISVRERWRWCPKTMAKQTKIIIIECSISGLQCSAQCGKADANRIWFSIEYLLLSGIALLRTEEGMIGFLLWFYRKCLFL